MNTPFLNFILPTSLIQNGYKIPLYLKDLIAKIQEKMEKSDIDGLFELSQESMEVNYRIIQEKLLNVSDLQYQKIEQILNEWSDQTNKKIDLHICYNLDFYYKLLLNNYGVNQIRFDNKFIKELEYFFNKMNSMFMSLIDDSNKNKMDDQMALALSMLKIDLISIATTLYFKEGIKCQESFLEKANNSLVQETHKIIKVFSKLDLPLIANNEFDIALEGKFNYGYSSNLKQDDEFAEPDLTEWNKSLD